MRRTSLVAAVSTAFLCSVSWITAGAQNSKPARPSQKRPVMATRLYSGADGQSHVGQSLIVLQDAQSAESTPLKMSDAYVVRAAPGTFESWHNAGKKRYIVVISGEAEVTTTSGEKARIVPGKIYIAEDLTGKGHTFRVVGNEDWVALFVNFAQ